MAILLSNNAEAPLAGGIDDTQTTIAVSAGQGDLFPSPTGGDWSPLTLTKLTGSTIVREIMRLTGRVGDTLTVVRAQEGTIATSFSTGAVVSLRMTAATYAAVVQKGENLDDLPNKVTAFTNIKQAATQEDTGVVEKATTAESQAGTAADKYPDVVGVKAAIDQQALRKASNLSDVANAATAFTNIKQAATETATGVVEKATTAESQAGTDADKYPDVVGVKAAIDSQALRQASNLSDVASAATAFTNIKQAATESATGVVEKATTAESQAGTTADRFPDVVGVKAAIDAQALRQSSNLSDVGSAATAFTNIKQAATNTSTGVVEKATNTEATVGTAADKFPDVVGVKAAIDAAIATLIDGSPGTLDTLNELAAALGDDPNFATTVTNSIATKLTAADNLSDVGDPATAFTNIKQAATETATGVVEKATTAEAQGGIATDKFPDVVGVKAAIDIARAALSINNDDWSGTDLEIANGGTGASSASAAFSALKQAATETDTGVVEKATTAESEAGTAADKFPDVVGVKAAIVENLGQYGYSQSGPISLIGTHSGISVTSGNLWCVRIGNMVTLKIDQLSHDSDASFALQDVIPAEFRPTRSVENIASISVVRAVLIRPNPLGSIEILYFDEAFANNAQTSIGSRDITISYIIEF